MDNFHLFPFDKIPKNSTVALYGAAFVADLYIRQVSSINYCKVAFLVDRNYEKINFINDVPVLCPDELLKREYDYVVIAVRPDSLNFSSILQSCRELGISSHKIAYNDTPLIFAQSTYSQFGEDMVISELFKILKIERPNYIDIGAFHPLNASNTALLYKQGCRGVNIEANADLLKNFHLQRPNDTNLNVAISTETREDVFYKFAETSKSTLLPHNLEYWKNIDPNLKFEEVRVQTITVDEVIKEYFNGVYPAFVSIDIEGLDYDVLKRCSFSQNTPYLICVEVEDTEMSKMNAMLAPKGFTPYCKMGVNTIYIRACLLPQILGEY